MELEGLRILYKDMKLKDIERNKFTFTYKNLDFEVIYFIDEKPHKLSIGVRKKNYYFEVLVNEFSIRPFIKDYNSFVKMLKLKYDSNNKYKPAYFFEELNKNIPIKASKSSIPGPSEIVFHRRDVEEIDKIYFVGWRDNNTRNENVSAKNLKKTKDLLSFKAYRMCEEKNVSSVWTDNPAKSAKWKVEELR